MSDHRTSKTAPESIGELSKNIIAKLAPKHPYSLTAAILRYRGVWNTYLADCLEAEQRGENSDLPHSNEASDVLANWDRPAEDLVEALMAVEFAIEDYETGEHPRIPAMLNAAKGWLSAEQKRREF